MWCGSGWEGVFRWAHEVGLELSSKGGMYVPMQLFRAVEDVVFWQHFGRVFVWKFGFCFCLLKMIA